RDFRQDNAPQSKREESGQGFMFSAKSGYTEGTVGVGLELYSALGLKLDSSDARPVPACCPTASAIPALAATATSRAWRRWRIARTELKVGGFTPKTPVLLSSDARLLPPIYNGATLTSSDIDNLTLDLGRFDKVNFRNSECQPRRDHRRQLQRQW
ncbi:OprD family outer membrane porin, partial [Pseudomonas aeruginosa]